MPNTPSKQPQLSIVLPCYNPPKNWEKNVVETIQLLEKQIQQPINLIIVNDGTTQQNLETAFKNIQSKLKLFDYVTYTENRGKGYALRLGVAKCNTKLIIYTDIDFPYTTKSLLALYTELKNKADVVLGHRGDAYYLKTPWIRKVISKLLRWFLKTFLRLPTDDSQCGIKGFNQLGKQAFLDTKIDRFLFDLEFIKLASKRKMKCNTVNVTLKPNIVFSKVSVKILATESLNFIKVLFRR